MKKKLFVSMLAVSLALGLAAVRLFSAEGTADPKEEVKTFEFKGSKQCITCHKELDDSVEVWQKQKHANAFATLATDAAKEFSDDPQKDPKCLSCHTTGYGKTGGFALDLDDKKKENLVNVTCESCHGAGEEYNKLMMKAKMGGTFDGDAGKAAGLVIPTEEVCLTCHNDQSPTFNAEEKFNFEEMSAKIKHGKKLEKKD